MTIELVTDRLVMRSWRAADSDPFAALNADPAVMEFFPATMSREQSDAFIDRIDAGFAERGFGLWALEVAATQSFVGFTGLIPMPEGAPGAGGMEVGWRLARSAWGNGYATEAGTAALRLAFIELGFDEIWSLTAEINTPSIAVMRRLGLQHVATADHPRLPAGSRLNPHVFYRITRREWDSNHVRGAWCHKTKTAIEPKSVAAVRVVPIPRALREILVEHRGRVDDSRSEAARCSEPFRPPV